MLKKKYSEEEEIDQKINVQLSLAEMQEMIEQKWDNMPKDKRKKALYKAWETDFNQLAKEINKLVGWKMYTIIK